MKAGHLLTHFDRLADAPDAIPRLRRFILDLAVRGKLVEQDPEDEPAGELLKRIAAEKKRMVEAREIKKEKPLPGIAPDEIPYNAPHGWEWVRLASSTITVQGFAFSSENFSTDPEAGYPLIKIGDIGTSAPEVFIRGSYDPTYLVNHGDILLGLSGSIKCAIWEGPTALLNQRIARIAPVSSDLLSVWLLFGVNACLDKWKDETSKLTVQNVKARQLYEALIPLPPLAEQHRIVAKVDGLMALCDRLETARKKREATRNRLATASLARLNAPDPDPAVFQNHTAFALNNLTPLTTRPDQIKALRQTILNLAVRGRLVEQDPEDEPAGELLKRIAVEKARLVKAGKIRKRKSTELTSLDDLAFELPIGWAVAKFSDVLAELQTGPFGSSLHQRDYEIGGTPVVNPASMQDGKIVPVEKMAVGTNTLERLSTFKLQAGDIVMGRRGEMGRCAVVTEQEDGWLCGTGSLILRLPRCLYPKYLAMLIGSPYVREYLGGFAVGATMQNLNQSILLKMSIGLPPLAEQHRIVAKVDELMAVCDRLEASLAGGEETRGRLMSALLHEMQELTGNRSEPERSLEVV